MSNLTVHEDSVLSKSLNQFWSKVYQRFIHDQISTIDEEPDLPFSWQAIMDEGNYNVFANSCLTFDDVILSTPQFRKENYYQLNNIKYEDASLQDEFSERSDNVCVVDGASVGDVPAVYTINGLLPHELPVKGTFVHPRIVPGFSYIVRPTDSYKPLFGGKAICLQRIGKGYGKRLTFIGDSPLDNNNYFWSDTNLEGYGFLLELVHIGDKFIVLDSDNYPSASVEVTRLMSSQKETDLSMKSNNKLEKHAYVSLQCSINYYEGPNSSNDTIIVSGIAIAVKETKSASPASVIKVRDCFINGELFTLVPTTSKSIRRTKFISGDVGDVPISYSIAGLLPNELPVIGTFVDPRITPGFKYKVRPVDSKKHLFGGKALALNSIGRGYGKRLTFAGESLMENDNYFWSDTNSQGYGFTLEALSEGDSFRIVNSSGDEIGEARVYKLCGPQIELESSFTKESKTCTKTVKVIMACNLSLNGNSIEVTTRIKGIAIVKRKGLYTSVQRIQDLEFPHLFAYQNFNEVLAFVRK